VAQAVGRKVAAPHLPSFGDTKPQGRRRGTGWGLGE
jgi:hypothetical protein